MKDLWAHSQTICMVLILLIAFTDWPADNVRHPDMLLISIDDLNDWGGCFGVHPQTRMPNTDRLAAGGMLSTNAQFAATARNPSHTAIMTGLSNT